LFTPLHFINKPIQKLLPGTLIAIRFKTLIISNPNITIF
jgi:hypothetical protein